MDFRKELATVWSSESGRLCPECGKPVGQCICKAASGAAVVGDGRVRVSLDRKGRRGKCVTLVSGVPLAASELKGLAKRLKARCGSGGTVKDGVIEIQGDHVSLLLTELKKMGYDAKRSGG